MKHTTRTAIACVLATAGLLNLGQVQASDIQNRKIKFSYPVAKDNPVGMAIDKFSEIVAKKSDGKLKVTGYPNAQLGNEIQSMSSAQGGIIEMAITSTAGAAGNVKELAVFDLPFLFSSEKEADAVVDSALGQELLDKFSDKRLIGLCYMDWGFRQVTNSKRPIAKLEDFAGLKIRTLQNRVYIDIFTALGATPLPLPYPETYTALETKAIDGQESSYLVTQSSSYQDIQKYLTETQHVYLPAAVLVSKKFWDKLSSTEQQILSSSCQEAKAYQRQISREMEQEVVDQLTKAGMQFNRIEPQQRQRMVEVTRPVFEKYKAELGAELVDRVQAIIDKTRQAN